MTDRPSFNVLTDPWIPLDDGGGRARYASFVEVIAGEQDAKDLVHPRDDCRFFARMLLSALAQALFPAKDRRELLERIARPLDRRAIDARIAQVPREDFELHDPQGFMQSALSDDFRKRDAPAAVAPATRSLFAEVPRKSRHLLFRPASAYDALCEPCATIVAFGAQAFAMEEGKSGFGLRGKSPGVCGRPATTTLIVLEHSVRATTWANTVHGQRAPELGYVEDCKRPWRQDAVDKSGGSSFGLLEGLFWQPRAFHFVSTADGVAGRCCACGACCARRVLPVAWRSKSRATGGTLYRHPWCPVRNKAKDPARKEELDFVHLPSTRPAWTGLVDLASPLASPSRHWHVAPVVRQWFESLYRERASLVVFDIGTTARDRATPNGRLCESFPLSLRLQDQDVVDAIRSCVADAEMGLDALRAACRRVLPREKAKQASRDEERLQDINAGFWQRTEPAFFAAYDTFVSPERDGAAWAVASERCRRAIRDAAFEIFDEWAAVSLGDPRRVAAIAKARAALWQKLGAWFRSESSEAESTVLPSTV